LSLFNFFRYRRSRSHLYGNFDAKRQRKLRRSRNYYIRYSSFKSAFLFRATDYRITLSGGGDGALLYELLKEKPKYVWMLEIDEDVMVACNKYMKSICGNVLETRKGDNYEVFVRLSLPIA
jgi:hypothetical protein